MDNDQLKELTKQVMDLRLDLARMDTKVDSIKDMQHKVEDHSVRLTTVEASSSSAHKRMDRIEKIHAGIAWTFGGGIVAAIVTFIVKGGLVK
jgi:phage shock protein A